MEHKETGCQAAPESPILCVNNYGFFFFGGTAIMNMCSKCRKDVMLKQEQEKLAASSFGNIANGTSSINANEPVVVAATVDVQPHPVEPLLCFDHLSDLISAINEEPKESILLWLQI
ncbi:hypothetical protein FF1_043708 [Malus domestica]